MRVQNNQFQLPKYIKQARSRSLKPLTFSVKSSLKRVVPAKVKNPD